MTSTVEALFNSEELRARRRLLSTLEAATSSKAEPVVLVVGTICCNTRRSAANSKWNPEVPTGSDGRDMMLDIMSVAAILSQTLTLSINTSLNLFYPNLTLRWPPGVPKLVAPIRKYERGDNITSQWG